MQPASRPFNKKGALGLIFVIMLMDIIGITVLNPVAPYLVRRYDERALMVTMITMIYAAGQFIAAPLMGKLGDRLGRRPVLLFSIAGQGAGYLIFGLGGSLWVLFAARLVGGITGGNLSTAAAYIADVSAPEERSKNFAMIGTAWSLGLILGPAAGGLMGTLALEAPAYIAAVLSFVNVAVGFFLLQESLPKDRRDSTPMRGADLNPIVAIVDMARKPGLGWLLVVTSLFNFAFNGINAVGALFVIDKFHAVTWQVSVMLMLGGGTIAVCNSLLVPRWVPRFGEKTTGAVSLLGMAVFDVAIFLVPSLWLVILISMAVSAMSSFTFPTLTTLATDRVSHSEVGLLLGVTTAIGSLMNILGPLSGRRHLRPAHGRLTVLDGGSGVRCGRLHAVAARTRRSRGPQALPPRHRTIDCRTMASQKILSPLRSWYLTPTRVVWQSDAGVTHSAELLRLGPDQAVLEPAFPPCTLTSVPDGAGGLLLDFGVELQGFVELVTPISQDKKPRKVRVRFGESASEAMAELGDPGNAGNDHAMRDQVVELPWLGSKTIGPSGFRFVRLDAVDPGLPVVLSHVRAVLVARDLRYVGSFRCDDERLNAIWKPGPTPFTSPCRTTSGTASSAIAWSGWGTCIPRSAPSTPCSASCPVVPDSLDLIRDITPVTRWMNGISSYSMWWVLIQEEWWMHHGDRAYLEGQRGYLRELLPRLAGFVGNDGAETLDGHRFLDWPTSGDPQAVHEGLQAMIVLTMESGARLSRALGDAESAALCSRDGWPVAAVTSPSRAAGSLRRPWQPWPV